MQENAEVVLSKGRLVAEDIEKEKEMGERE